MIGRKQIEDASKNFFQRGRLWNLYIVDNNNNNQKYMAKPTA